MNILIPDNIFFLYLIIIKLCTLNRLENVHQKLKLIFHNGRDFLIFGKFNEGIQIKTFMTFEVGQEISGINPQGFHASLWERG